LKANPTGDKTMEAFIQNMIRSLNNYQLAILKNKTNALLEERKEEVLKYNVQVYWEKYRHQFIDFPNDKVLTSSIRELVDTNGVLGNCLRQWRDEILDLVVMEICNHIEIEKAKKAYRKAN
jgi:predicted metal-dependent peptidase